MNTTATKTVIIRTRTAGRNFGFVSEIVARNHRVLWTSEAFGTEQGAEVAAQDRAAKLGWTVA